MKNIFLLSLSLIVFIVLTSCGSGDTKKSDSPETDSIPITVRKAPTDRVSPEAIDPEKPIEASKIYDSFYEWTGTEVIIAGYAKMDSKTEKYGKQIRLCESPKSMNILFNCEFSKDLNKEIKQSDIVIIKGTLAENSYWGFELKDCKLLEINGKYKKDQNPDPFTTQNDAYWVSDLYKACDKWNGKEITVIGHYNSTTTSTSNGNTTWRIDLENPETGKKLIGCTMKTEPDSDKLSKNRDNIKIRGKVTRDQWGTVQLIDCIIVQE